jgi:hypothetical protein
MANVTITGLAAAAALTGTEVLAIDQSGSTVKTTVQDVANLAGGSGFTLTTVGTLGTDSSVIYNAGSKVFASTAAGTQTLSILSYPSITLNAGMGGSFSGTLSSITISDLPYLELSVSSISTLVTVSLPALTTMISTGMNPNLSMRSCSSLTTVNIPALNNVANSLYIDWSGNAFSQATIDDILVKFAAASGNNCTLILNGGTSAAPSATGLAAKATLEGRGWSVTTNE